MAETSSEKTREPFVRVTKRTGIHWYQSWGIRIVAVFLALIVNALFIHGVTGLNPVEVYRIMWTGTFESKYNFLTTLRDMSILYCVALALAPAFRMRFWNIGGEGQVLMGALASALLMIYADQLPNGLLLPLMILCSAVFGAVWAFIPAWFKAKWNTNETLFTLMMNYVAINIVNALTNIWRGAKSSLGTLNTQTKAGWWPKFLGYRFMPFILIVTALAIFIKIYIHRSKHGYELSVLGDSPNTARYAGINVKKVILRTMILSGALCGLAGFGIVSGVDMTISSGTARGYGFTAIIVAWLAHLEPEYMALISFLLIFLDKGAAQITSAYSVLNDYASQVITAIILFFILGSEFFVNYRLVFRSRHPGTPAPAPAAASVGVQMTDADGKEGTKES